MTGREGLWLWATVLAADFGALVWDWCLFRAGEPLISAFARRHWWAAVAILLFQLAGVVGLGFHFARNGMVD